MQNLVDAEDYADDGETILTGEFVNESIGEEYSKEFIDEKGDSNKPEHATNPPALLDPNHPLLERFQKSLKDYLQKQIQHYKEDIISLEAYTKDTDNELHQLGGQDYDLQQLVTRQQSDIDNCLNELESLSASKEELEQELDELNIMHKKEKTGLLEAERKEMELKNEIQYVDALLYQMKKWEEEIESGLHVKQRESDKSRQDKIKLAAEKKQQDILLYKQMSEVWRLEGQIQTILMQLKVMEEVRESSAEAMAQSNIEIETNEADQRALTKAWQSIIVTISYRDKYYNKLMVQHKEMKDKVASLNCEIRIIKKKCNEELQQNQSNSVLQESIAESMKYTKLQIHQLLKTSMVLNTQLHEQDEVMQQLEQDTQRLQQESNLLINHIKDIEKQRTKLTKIKYRIEDEICRATTERTNDELISVRQLALLTDYREVNREQKIALVRLENANSRTLRDLNLNQLHLHETTHQLDALRLIIAKEDHALTVCDKDNVKNAMEMTKFMRRLGNATTKLNLFMNTSYVDMSPMLLKIRNLESAIADITEKTRATQTFWLREQEIVMELTMKRQKQIKDLNVLKKQITIMDQKNLKITDQLEMYAKREEAITRTIEQYQTKLSVYAEQLYKMKGSKTELEIYNNYTQSDLATKLEEEEFDSIKIKNELSEIREDKVYLCKDLLEKNREALGWEKKIKMTVDARKTIAKELSDEGEIGKIKTEIHRMEIRYSQIRKTQEKLLCELEQCITRREDIMSLAEARTKNTRGGVQRMKIIISRKIDNMKNKVQQIENQQTALDAKFETLTHLLVSTKEQMEISKNAVIIAEDELVRMNQDISEAKMKKQLSLDMLLYKERKLKVYTELARGRSPFLVYRTNQEMSAAYQQTMKINTKLRFILEYLIKEFPPHQHFFAQIYNCLVLPAMQ